MRKAQELGWSSIAYVILFTVGALILLTFVFRNVPELQGAFTDTICKMNAWMRASTLGSPLMQSLLGIGGFFTGGFSTLTMSSINIPLACNPGSPIDAEPPVGLEPLLIKVGNEAVRCWDNFGGGNWDPLVFYSQGQYFKCYEEIITISCTENEAVNLVYDESFVEGIDWPREENDYYLTRDFMRYFFSTRQVGFAGFDKTYANSLPSGFPYYQGIGQTDKIRCDGLERDYLVGLYFVDAFHGTLRGASYVPLICTTIQISAIGSDIIVLCTQDMSGAEVTI